MERIELQLYSILLVLIVMAGTVAKRRVYSPENKAFLGQCATILFMLVLDILTFVYEGVPGAFSRRVNVAANFLYFLFVLVMVSPWLSYLDLLLFNSTDRLKRRLFYLQPALIGFVVMFASVGTPFVFYLDGDNHYHRGPGVWLLTGISWLVICFTWYFILRNRARLDFRTRGIVGILAVIPFAGNSLQLLFVGTSLVWPFAGLTVTIIFIFLEIRSEPTDYLTGLINRVQLDQLLEYRVNRKAKNRLFTIVMIDMNGFKAINDGFGHLTGDHVLSLTARILQKELDKNDRAARFGGDEFLLYLATGDEAAVRERMGRIQGQLDAVNESGKYPFRIGMSWGYAISGVEAPQTLEQLYVEADRMMYARKREIREGGPANG